jgi:hypothetical protein
MTQPPNCGRIESSQQKLYLFDKLFEEEGPLGKGITVGKVQVALMSPDRGKESIFRMLEDNSRWIADDNESSSLADLAHDVCLTLLRKKDIWIAASSDSRWFSGNDSGKAETLHNEWANNEAAKFEKVGISWLTILLGRSITNELCILSLIFTF